MKAALMALLCAGAALAPASGAWASPLAPLQAAAGEQLEQGFDHPDAAMQGLQKLHEQQAGMTPGQPEWRVLTLARGLVAAGAGRQAEAQAAASALAALPQPALAAADAALVRAVAADSAGDAAHSVQQAQTALQIYRRECVGSEPAADCDHRMQWRALQLIARQWLSQGKTSLAREHALAAAELARAHGDTWRQATSLTTASRASDSLGERDHADRQASQALRLARLDGSPMLLARMALFESVHRQARGDAGGARRAAEQGLPWAQRARSPRLEAMLLANLSDSYLHAGLPKQALQAIDRALPVVRRLGDRRSERILLANAGLARIAMGQLAAARGTLEELFVAFGQAGAATDQAQLLREFANALAAAGETRAALDLYHRERQLKADLMAANRDTALAELRSRFDREAQQRQLDQLARDHALINAQLANRASAQKLWAGGAVVLGLAAVLVVLLYRRVRHVNRQLAQNHDVLRVQSQRDPLTGLANRRCLAERVPAGTESGAADPGYSGTLLLVDIDHFKHVNDDHGHTVGDAVLAAVAQRLQAVVREQDLVVRWGGEEFLIHAPALSAAQARALAQRVLEAVGDAPVLAAFSNGGQRLVAVTASVGYGSFPLPPCRLPVSLDRAINLTDMALYTAKNQGRNRAIGMLTVSAADGDALRAVEADFDLAWRDGRVALERLPGPAQPAAGAGAPATAPQAQPA